MDQSILDEKVLKLTKLTCDIVGRLVESEVDADSLRGTVMVNVLINALANYATMTAPKNMRAQAVKSVIDHLQNCFDTFLIQAAELEKETSDATPE